jgi:hypothetical protein
MGGSTESNTVPKNLKKLEALYEKLERDPNLEKAFLTDKKKFLEEHGFNEKEVNKLIDDLQKSRIDELSSVLKEQEEKLN